jgi:hypothetical protein
MGWELEKIHNIRRLVALFEQYGHPLNCADDDIDFMDSICRSLSPLEEAMLPHRAPNAEDAARALRIASDTLARAGSAGP